MVSDNQKAFNLGYNSYRIGQTEARSPFAKAELTSQYNQGWNKARNYFANQDKLLRSSNFG